MQERPGRPVLVVLGGPAEQAPDLTSLGSRVEVRNVAAADLPSALDGAGALLLWDFFSGALQEAWDRAVTLEWVHVAAAGVDTLLFPELVESDVVVTNARGVFDRPIAEYVLAALLAHAKDLRGSWDLQRDSVWKHREPQRLAGSRALVVGTGGIGRATARLLKAVGVEVVGAGRTARDGDPDFGRVVASDRLVDHLADVDHLVIAAPLTAATRGLIDSAVLAALPPTAHLVNVGRGPIVAETALLEALRTGDLAAATLDVFDTEPLPSDHPLWTAPGVTVTAHMSGDVVGWRDTLAQQFVDLAEHWLAGRRLPNVVDKALGFGAPSGPEENHE